MKKNVVLRPFIDGRNTPNCLVLKKVFFIVFFYYGNNEHKDVFKKDANHIWFVLQRFYFQFVINIFSIRWPRTHKRQDASCGWISLIIKWSERDCSICQTNSFLLQRDLKTQLSNNKKMSLIIDNILIRFDLKWKSTGRKKKYHKIPTEIPNSWTIYLNYKT